MMAAPDHDPDLERALVARLDEIGVALVGSPHAPGLVARVDRAEVGLRADLIAVPATSIRQTVAEAPADRMVLRGGRLVARTTSESVIHLS